MSELIIPSRDEIFELCVQFAEYLDLDDSEVGEYCWNLLELVENSHAYMSEEMLAMAWMELLDLLTAYENDYIIETTECTHTSIHKSLSRR